MDLATQQDTKEAKELAELTKALDTFEGDADLAVEYLMQTKRYAEADREDRQFVSHEARSSGATASSSLALWKAQRTLASGNCHITDRCLYMSPELIPQNSLNDRDAYNESLRQLNRLAEGLPFAHHPSVMTPLQAQLLSMSELRRWPVVFSPKSSEIVAMTVGPEAMKQLENHMLPTMLQLLETVTLRAMDVTLDSPVGAIRVKVENLVLHLEGSECDVDLEMSSDGIGMKVSGLLLSAKAIKWSWAQIPFPHMNGEGTLNFSARLSELATVIWATAMDKAYLWSDEIKFRLGITTTKCSLDDLNLKVSEASGSWLYNLIVTVFRDTLRAEFEARVSAVLEDAATPLSQMLPWLPIVAYAIQEAEGSEGQYDTRYVDERNHAGATSEWGENLK